MRNNGMNTAFADACFFCDATCTHPKFMEVSNNIYGLNRIFRRTCSFSFCRSISFKHISCVVDVRSYIEMVRIYTRRIITFVKNPFPFWNRSIMNLPRNAVRKPVSTLVGKFLRTNKAISFIIFCSNPIPTIRRFLYVLKKSNRNIGKRSFEITKPTTSIMLMGYDGTAINTLKHDYWNIAYCGHY